VRDLLNELGLGADPVSVDDDGLLWLAPACDDWAPIVDQHGLSAVIDLEAGLDAGIPCRPNQVIYVYFPFKDEDVPTLHKLHAIARLGAALVQAGERVLGRALGRDAGADAALRAVERLAYGMSALIAAIAALMEVKPF